MLLLSPDCFFSHLYEFIPNEFAYFFADCFCTVKIVDQSHRSSGISVNVFAENMEKLPHVESAGDIIQFSHVVVFPERKFPWNYNFPGASTNGNKY